MNLKMQKCFVKNVESLEVLVGLLREKKKSW